MPYGGHVGHIPTQADMDVAAQRETAVHWANVMENQRNEKIQNEKGQLQVISDMWYSADEQGRQELQSSPNWNTQVKDVFSRYGVPIVEAEGTWKLPERAKAPPPFEAMAVEGLGEGQQPGKWIINKKTGQPQYHIPGEGEAAKARAAAVKPIGPAQAATLIGEYNDMTGGMTEIMRDPDKGWEKYARATGTFAGAGNWIGTEGGLQYAKQVFDTGIGDLNAMMADDAAVNNPKNAAHVAQAATNIGMAYQLYPVREPGNLSSGSNPALLQLAKRMKDLSENAQHPYLYKFGYREKRAADGSAYYTPILKVIPKSDFQATEGPGFFERFRIGTAEASPTRGEESYRGGMF